MDEFLKEIQSSFLVEAEDFLVQSETLFLKLEKKEASAEDLKGLKRIFHNLKGSGKAVGFDHIASFSHEIENLIILLSVDSELSNAIELLVACNDQMKSEIEKLKNNQNVYGDFELFIELLRQMIASFSQGQKPEAMGSEQSSFILPITVDQNIKNETPEVSYAKSDDSIRVPLKRIDEILEIFGEQVIHLSTLEYYGKDYSKNNDLIERTIFGLKKLTYDLQQQTLLLRMINLKGIKSKVERVIRDTSIQLGKKVNFEFVGSELELDKIIVDQLSDPLIHMIRNSVDHGMESIAEREASGKPTIGQIKVIAKREGGAFVLTIEDDGRGLSREKILQKAIQNKIITSHENLSDSQVFDLIFENGFSTKDSASEISGRGVGMNVVKEMILSMKGSYEISSIQGKGTTFKIKLPLSLSLFNGVVFEVAKEKYVFPSSQINEIVDAKNVSFLEVDNKRSVVKYGENLYQFIDLNSLLYRRQSVGLRDESPSVFLLAIIQNQRIAIRIDRLLSIQKIAQKPLGKEMKACPGASGLTILGDGRPVMILDMNIVLSETRSVA